MLYAALKRGTFLWRFVFPSYKISLLVSPGIDTSLTGGEGCLVLESLPPGDQLPRSRWEEAVEEDVTTGAKVTVWGENERRREGATPSCSPCAPCNKWPCSWCFRLKCVLFHILSCFWGKLCLKIEFIFMFSFKGYNRRIFGEAHILTKAAVHSGTQTLAIGLIHHVKPARLLLLLADVLMWSK